MKWFTVLLLGVVLSVKAEERGVFLVKDGASQAAIVLPDGASADLQEIAGYFVRVVERATGARLPVVTAGQADQVPMDQVKVFLGADAEVAEKLPPETYQLICRGQEIRIRGKDDLVDVNRIKPVSLPVLWAVDDLLEKGLGVRWLWPGELGTYVPKSANFFVPEQEVTYQPRLIQRSLRIALTFNHPAKPTSETIRVAREAVDWAEHHQAGRRGNFKFGHAYAHWWEKFSKTHPDYFMQPPPGIDLSKIPSRYIKLRLANPVVIEEIAKEYIAAGAPTYWNVCPNDGSGFDTSAETRAWDIPSDLPVEEIWFGRANLTPRYVMFWNRLGERLREINPEVILCTYAYSAYKSPPPPERPLKTKMVIALVSTYHDYDMWKGWKDSGATIMLRPNWWHVGANAPYLPLKEEADFLKMAWASGMVGLDMDSLMGYWGTQGLNYYLVARLMNHPELTEGEIIDEYVSAFGAGRDKIREYFAYWQKITSEYRYLAPDGQFQKLLGEGRVDRVLTRASRHLLPLLYTEEVLAPADRLLDEATAAIPPSDTESRERVDFLRDGLREMRATRDLVAISVSSGPDKKARFEKQSGELHRIRQSLNAKHVIWNAPITQDEDRRGVYFQPRFQAPKDEETGEM